MEQKPKTVLHLSFGKIWKTYYLRSEKGASFPRILKQNKLRALYLGLIMETSWMVNLLDNNVAHENDDNYVVTVRWHFKNNNSQDCTPMPPWLVICHRGTRVHNFVTGRHKKFLLSRLIHMLTNQLWKLKANQSSS